jgi:F-box protein 21
MELKKPSLLDLPAEIIQHILRLTSPEDAVNFGLANKRLHVITKDPLLWRSYHRTEYNYGDCVSDDNREKAKDMFQARRQIDAEVYAHFEQIVNRSQSRIPHIEAIASHGLNAKDVLLQIIGERASLSQHYWASAVLDRIHRAQSIDVWKSHGNRFDMPRLAEMLAAFDVFVLENRIEGDFGGISTELRKLADILKAEHPHLMEEPLQRRAAQVAEFLRSRNFTGVLDDDDYHNLRNNFIGLALFHPKHEALPLICTAIYCSLAREVGLEAHPCNFPYHVYAMITSGTRELPGIPSRDSFRTIEEHLETPIYIDAFRPGLEIQKEDLETVLREIGASVHSHQRFLSPADPVDMVLRTVQNIMRSIQIVHSQGQPDPGAPPRWATVFPDLDLAFYATLWATILLGTQASEGDSISITTNRRRYLPFLVEHFKMHYPWDVGLVEEHILPLFHGLPEFTPLREAIHVTRVEDLNMAPVMRRDPWKNQRVKYFIGQVFRHKRYGYLGVIKGWDVVCSAGEDWIRQMNVDGLAHGRQQSFYHVLYV